MLAVTPFGNPEILMRPGGILLLLDKERAAIAMKFPREGHRPMQKWCALE
jgi:hypothetical protein